MTAREAVSRYVADGDVVYAGYTQVPMALAHEVIRQQKQNLTLVGASLGGQATELIMAGCCSAVQTGYLGGALRPGPIQDRMADGRLRFDDSSNGAIAMMLLAGAFGLPFVPVKWFLGTDYLRPEYEAHPHAVAGRDKWKVIDSPFGDGERYVALPALRPDVALVHLQRADAEGNAQGWGAFGDSQWALWAARKVIVSVEEIVPAEVIRRDPNRTLVPGFRVAAVVHAPWGAHPTSVPGYYDYDYPFFAATGSAARSDAGFAAYRAEWIDGVADRAGYLAHLEERFGADWLDTVRVTEPITPLDGVNYGYAPQLAWPGGSR
jgi:glutaconate CoA-transferase subunit A